MPSITPTSWARLEAAVVGRDFSAPTIEAARSRAADTRIFAEFVEGNVYDAPQLVQRRLFDVVYTGLGALMWLPDIERWADVAATLPAPDGQLYLTEFHPTQWMLSESDPLHIVDSYFTEETRFAIAGS